MVIVNLVMQSMTPIVIKKVVNKMLQKIDFFSRTLVIINSTNRYFFLFRSNFDGVSLIVVYSIIHTLLKALSTVLSIKFCTVNSNGTGNT